MRFFEFGTAPAAKALGYKMVSVVQATPDQLTQQHDGEDLIFVYGAELHSQPGTFEFARFEPVEAACALAASERLFMGVFPAGIVYADRSREEFGDYLKLAFLPYDTLILDLRPRVPDDLRSLIEAHAAQMRARAGQEYQTSTCGQTVLLGSKLMN